MAVNFNHVTGEVRCDKHPDEHCACMDRLARRLGLMVHRTVKRAERGFPVSPDIHAAGLARAAGQIGQYLLMLDRSAERPITDRPNESPIVY